METEIVRMISDREGARQVSAYLEQLGLVQQRVMVSGMVIDA